MDKNYNQNGSIYNKLTKVTKWSQIRNSVRSAFSKMFSFTPYQQKSWRNAKDFWQEEDVIFESQNIGHNSSKFNKQKINLKTEKHKGTVNLYGFVQPKVEGLYLYDAIIPEKVEDIPESYFND